MKNGKIYIHLDHDNMSDLRKFANMLHDNGIAFIIIREGTLFFHYEVQDEWVCDDLLKGGGCALIIRPQDEELTRLLI